MSKFRILALSLLVCFVLPSFADATNAIGWTPRRAKIWNEIQKTNKGNWWTEIQNHAINDNFGLRDAMLYKITGNAEYAQKSWNRAKNFCGEHYQGTKGNCKQNYKGGCFDNCKRDRFGRMATAYSLIADALPPDDKADYKDILTLWTKETFCEADPSLPSQGVRSSDSDELIGNYFGLVTFAMAIADEDPEFSKAILNHGAVKSGGNCFETPAVGGMDATGNNRSTMRNTVNQYIDYAQGEWIESSQYNLATVGTYLMMGIDAINDFYGVNKFPEFNPQDYTDMMLALLTPDLKQNCRWGDVQDDWRGLFPYQFVSYSAANAYLSQDPKAAYIFSDVWSSNGENSLPDTWYWWLDLDLKREMPLGQLSYDNKGKIGWSMYRTDTGKGQSLFCAEASDYTKVDHESKGISNFNLYRNGNWAFTNPRGYYSGNNEEEGFTNGIWLGGISQGMREASGKSAHESGDGYLYQAYATAGNQAADRYDAAPNEWVHEYNRSLVYLRNADHSDTIVIFDRVNTCDWLHDKKCMEPWRIGRLDKLTQKRGCGQEYSKGKGCSASTDGKHKIFFHASNQAEKNNDTFSWKALNSETVYLTAFLKNYQHDEDRMADLWKKGAPYFIGGDYSNAEVSELVNFYKLTFIPEQIAGFQTWAFVLHAGGENPPLAQLRSEPSPETASGVHIGSGEDEKILIFNATENTPPAPSTLQGKKCKGPDGYCVNHDPERFEKTKQLRLFKKGFKLDFETKAAAQIFIFDLDPSKTWAAELNGAALNIAVSDQGVGIISINEGKNSLIIRDK